MTVFDPKAALNSRAVDTVFVKTAPGVPSAFDFDATDFFPPQPNKQATITAAHNNSTRPVQFMPMLL